MAVPLSTFICDVCGYPVVGHRELKTCCRRSGHRLCIESRIHCTGDCVALDTSSLIDLFTSKICGSVKSKKNVKCLLREISYELAKCQEEIAAANAERDDLEHMSHDLEDNVEALKNELNRANDAKLQTAADHTSTVNELNRHLAHYKMTWQQGQQAIIRNRKLESEVEQLKSARDLALAEVIAITAERDKVSEDLLTATHNVNEKVDQISTLENSLNMAEVAHKHVIQLSLQVDKLKKAQERAIDQSNRMTAERNKFETDLQMSKSHVAEKEDFQRKFQLDDKVDCLKYTLLATEIIDGLKDALESAEVSQKEASYAQRPNKMVQTADIDVSACSTTDELTWVNQELRSFDKQVARLRGHLKDCFEILMGLQTACPTLSSMDAVRQNRSRSDVVMSTVDRVSQMIISTVDTGITELQACDDCPPTKMARYG